MNIDLRPELEQLIERKLATGRYADRGAVIEEALEFVQRRDEWIAQVQAGVQQGRDDIAAGRYFEVNSPADAQALREEISRRVKERQAERNRAAH